MKKKRQDRAPLLEAIERYHAGGYRPFTVPGHKLGRGADPEALRILGRGAFLSDVQIAEGLDDREESNDYRGQAEELAAEVFGADETYFSVNGSSLSAHVALLTVASAGETVLVASNTHKSMTAALILAGVKSVHVPCVTNPAWDLDHGVSPATLRHCLEKNPGARAVIVVSPDYYGVTPDLRTLASICHEHGIPLIVDEAWGSHFPFHPELPESAMRCGADLSFGSIHKTMSGLTMAAMLHLRGDLVDRDRFELCFDLFESTSPSSVILASCDASRRQMTLHGKELWSRALSLARHARSELRGIPGLRVLGREILGEAGIHDLDETKLVVDVSGFGVTGYEAQDWLRKRRRLCLELADHRHLLAVISVADTFDTVRELISGLRDMAKWAGRKWWKSRINLPPVSAIETESVMPPHDAFFGETELVPLEESVGRIAAEMVSPYPPGISRIGPGDLITEALVQYFREGVRLGMYVPDCTDETLRKIRVVKRAAELRETA